MIKIENGVTTAEGSAQTITKEWYDLTVAVIDGLEENIGITITIESLIQGAEMLKENEDV